MLWALSGFSNVDDITNMRSRENDHLILEKIYIRSHFYTYYLHYIYITDHFELPEHFFFPISKRLFQL